MATLPRNVKQCATTGEQSLTGECVTMVLGWLRKKDTTAVTLYGVVVDHARDPWFYSQGNVADTVDGRFDMVALMLSLVLVRLEASGEGTLPLRHRLRELFVDDMDQSVREMGVGDLSVSRHVKRMMGALDGRFMTYRPLLLAKDHNGLMAALERNLYRGEPASNHSPDMVAERILKLSDQLGTRSEAQIIAGDWGQKGQEVPS
jgi:cytochrome b pre-mRNA-processing protein 3